MDSGLKNLAPLQNLKILSISKTNLTDAGLKDIAQLKGLTELDLLETRVTRQGVAELQKALPTCLIRFKATN
jgi:hypothetical protein